ncbi:MAG: hypothetical protein AAGC46_03695, partial [Solirubrobacteraceae bacterium]|nr:hypothetical protein [Patulibacter sp.]
HIQGARVDDLIGVSGGVMLVSPLFQSMLCEERATGWSLVPVAVKNRTLRAALDGYAGLAVSGRGGAIDFDRAERTMSASAHPTPIHRGLPVSADRWDGSDLFRADDLGYVFLTPRIAAAITRHALSGISTEPAADHELYSSEVELMMTERRHGAP